MNAQRKSANLEIPPWTGTTSSRRPASSARASAPAAATRRSQFLAALEAKLGAVKGLSVFNDLREQDDPSAPTTLATPRGDDAHRRRQHRRRWSLDAGCLRRDRA